ncbi:anti-lipopolysaccharide factor-like [Portunus trituberculatus]|uniref:anti-lipopolysaccharide factor-like n=1 Tax=Portunus trituberculatus TaxID=210409 RepID=UPI001E1CB18E|nr:anti-lipopolysaccharide factor-like [Portunus trituberculatus]
MHVSRPWAVVVAVVVVMALPTPTQGGLLDIVKSIVVPAARETIKTQEITLLDHYCTLSRSPYIKRFELHYRADVTCPGWTSIKGRGSNHTNPTNSEKDALKDFMTQAVAAGLVTKEEAAPWLNHR